MIDLSTVPQRKQFVVGFAQTYSIDPVLLCALIEHESSWNTFAVRFEPAFYTRYTAQMSLNDTEEYTRAMSFGLMQIMGETARELGFQGHYLSQLCDEQYGVTYGCKKLRRCLDLHPGDEVAALLAYNGGSDKSYPLMVINLKSKYQGV